VREIPAGARPFLQRLGLEAPSNFKDRLVQRLLVLELTASGNI
jgi:hypothetical protein